MRLHESKLSLLIEPDRNKITIKDVSDGRQFSADLRQAFILFEAMSLHPYPGKAIDTIIAPVREAYHAAKAGRAPPKS